MTFTLRDDSELWLADIIDNHYEEARSRVSELLEEGIPTDTGCMVTDTTRPRKVRFHGRQVAAYRLIYALSLER